MLNKLWKQFIRSEITVTEDTLKEFGWKFVENLNVEDEVLPQEYVYRLFSHNFLGHTDYLIVTYGLQTDQYTYGKMYCSVQDKAVMLTSYFQNIG